MEKVSFENIRDMLVENCMLKVPVDQILEDTPLFGPGSLGLDSIDALQLTMAIEAKFGTPVQDPELARQILRSPETIRAWVEREQEARV